MPSAPDPSSPITDDVLAQRAQAGDLAAFNALVVRYQGPVFGLCLRMLSSREAAEDAAQEAFLSAWRAIRSYRGGSFQGWILRIAGNQSRDELRRRKRRPADSLDRLVENAGDGAAGASQERSPEQRSLGTETVRQVQAGLNRLPPDQREAVILSDVQGLSYEEIADAMGTSVGTVKSRISRGRARLRDHLRGVGELPGATARLDEQDETPTSSPARSRL